MKPVTAFFVTVIIGAVSWTVNAQTIVCDGKADGGSGIVSCDPSPRDYVYRVAHPSPQAPESVYVGTHDPNPANYTSFCLPPGWTWTILPTSAVPWVSTADYNSFTPHGTVSPGPTGACPYVLFFEGPLPAATPLDFGFNHLGYPHNVSWRMAGFPIGTSNWNNPVGLGAGPVHGPSDCDTTCLIPPNTRVTNVILAGKKDDFITSDGVEPAFPGPALLTQLNNCSTGPLNTCHPTLADCEFDCPALDKCFGHTFTRCWDTCGCVVGATLSFKLKATGNGCGNDGLYLLEDGVQIWGIHVSDLRNFCVGIPTWNVDDVLECSIDLAHLPPSGAQVTYVLGTLLDGDLDVYIQDDTEVDYLELTVTTCCERCCATGDVNGDGVPLTAVDLAFLIDFLYHGGPAPQPLCWGDLNGDGFISQLDIDIFQCYFIYGMQCFPAYPVPAQCLPVAVHCACGIWGDVSGDGQVNPVDVVKMVNFVYKSNDTRVQPPNCPKQAGDADCTGAVNPVDVVLYVNRVYKSNLANWCANPCGL